LKIRYVLEQPSVSAQVQDQKIGEFEEWKTLHKRIIVCINQVWLCVRDTLCNDAPEGYMPDELEEDSEMTTKDVLSYTWRAMKEARYTDEIAFSVII
jgi:hypothetical protein